METCNLDCSVLVMEIPSKGKWLGWGGEPYVVSVAFLGALRGKLFLSMSVPIFINNFPCALSFFGNLCHINVGRDEVDAFKVLTNTCCT